MIVNTKDKKILGIVRKSPTNSKEAQTSIAHQKKRIIARASEDFEKGIIKSNDIDFAVDICKGDDEDGRVQFHRRLLDIDRYERAYCLNVDRFSRSWLGLKWLHEHFLGDCKIHFVEGMPDMYDEKGNIKENAYLFFFIQCGFAQWELMRIRTRTRAGIDKLTPEQRKQKYKGRPKGAKDKRKRNVKNYKARWKKERLNSNFYST